MFCCVSVSETFQGGARFLCIRICAYVNQRFIEGHFELFNSVVSRIILSPQVCFSPSANLACFPRNRLASLPYLGFKTRRTPLTGLTTPSRFHFSACQRLRKSLLSETYRLMSLMVTPFHRRRRRRGGRVLSTCQMPSMGLPAKSRPSKALTTEMFRRGPSLAYQRPPKGLSTQIRLLISLPTAPYRRRGVLAIPRTQPVGLSIKSHAPFSTQHTPPRSL